MASPTGVSWAAYERQQTAKKKARAAKRAATPGSIAAASASNKKTIDSYRAAKGQKNRRTTGR